ncbi:MAG: plastocyanin/azurin family copper-binding protein, partial [Actinomycetota bacterium]
VGLVAALALTACAGESKPPGGGAGDSAKFVAIDGFAFEPATLSVKAGAKVTWQQKDNTVHTVTSGEAGDIDPLLNRVEMSRPDGKFNSGDVQQGGTFSFTFSEPGTFKYYCSNHPEGMRAEIIVR